MGFFGGGNSMKHCKYIITLAFSLLLTSMMFVKLIEGVSYSASVVCDFLAMIGGGIFCSTLVSWFVEEQNKAKEKRNKEEQRKFILVAARNGFIRLIERELVELSTYYAKYLSTDPGGWVREDIGLVQISEKIVWLLTEIEVAEETERERDCCTITTDHLKKDEDKKKRLVVNNKMYYKSLQQTLLELSTFYNTYLIADVITTQQIETLKELAWEVNDVLMYEPDFGIDDGTILMFKRLLFEKASRYFACLDISTDDTGHAHYRNVFH